MAPKDLYFITGNANKLREVKEILATTPVELRSHSLDLPELQGTIEEISRDKCARAATAVSTSTFNEAENCIENLHVCRLMGQSWSRIRAFASMHSASCQGLMCKSRFG